MQSKGCCGVEIEEVEKGGGAERHGIRAGDRLVTVNGQKVRDLIDLMFHRGERDLTLVIEREGQRRQVTLRGDENGAAHPGLVLKHFRVKTCRNKCLFCFVSQLPRGLRRSLYVKDEDYRMSFLYGNYVTLTNLSKADRNRIVEQRLSPLYISVHSTRNEVRNELIGNPKAPDIVKEIRFLADNKIRMHTQIVLCPGYNDGDLARTIADLYRFYPYVMSVAVVPVGLTAHRKDSLKPVGREDALKALQVVQRFQSRFKKKHGEPIVYASDEIYIRAGVDFPPLELYGDLPQIENGVGMVPLFLEQAKKLKVHLRPVKKRFIIITGVSFYPYLSGFLSKLRKSAIEIEAVPVENSFFGTSVTVTGLLTGRDVIKSLSGVVKTEDVLLIPDIVMREGHEVFLDDVARHDVETALGVKTLIIESTPKGLVRAVTDPSSVDLPKSGPGATKG